MLQDKEREHIEDETEMARPEHSSEHLFLTFNWFTSSGHAITFGLKA